MAQSGQAWTFVRRRRYVALRTGVAAAAASVAPSFARGILPRSTTDQAIITGATAAYWLGASALGLGVVESVSELVVKARRAGDPEDLTLAASAGVCLAGAAVVAAIPNSHEVHLPMAILRSGAWIVSGGALATSGVMASDRVLTAATGRSRALPTNVAIAAVLGVGTSAARVWLRNKRASRLGESPDRSALLPESRPRKLATSAATGAAVGGGLVAAAAVEFAVAEGTTALVSRLLGRRADPVTPLVGHATAALGIAVAGAYGLGRVRRRVMGADDVVEPAYPDPPTSPHVTAGPRSIVAFDAIGKEGRRFVLMALTPREIAAVMGQPAIAPVRVVAGFGSASTPEQRAAIALEEMERLGAFDRSLVVVAAPTGVGYVNYSFAEAVEYLTRGDCAIVVPQYALLPSAMALHLTEHAQQQHALILEGIRDRLASVAEHRRPRVVNFGESLGAEVALDVAAVGTSRFAELGLQGGLYLGTPFRAELWERWIADPGAVDPEGLLGQVSRADEIPALPASVRHVQVIHHDDPVTMFSYESVVRAPRWMGPPATRPPGVPRETIFRPVITFIISLIDLKNGMDSKPGEFVRRGHDYRIELCDAVRWAYRLDATPEQADRIEQALRDRERDWATRRMVARRFASARDSVRTQLARWGVDSSSIDLDEQTAAALVRGGMVPATDESAVAT